MIARFFVDEEDVHVDEEAVRLKVVHNGKTENIWPLSNGKIIVSLGTTNAHVIALRK